MKKAILLSTLFFITWVIISCIIYNLYGLPEWLFVSVIGGIGGFFGTLSGYRIGKKESEG